MNDLRAALDGLRGQVRGPVITPDDDGYAEEIAGVNLAAAQRPAVVVGASRVEDVVAGVRFGTANGLPIRVQATGHGVGAGRGASDGLLITTRRMRELEIDPSAKTARVGAGLLWSDVIEAIAPHGLAGACGSAPAVGVVGYLLGGGVGPIGRTYGWGADHVTAIELVTADGGIREVDADTDPDLFWALRGGKVGVGVVTSITMSLFPLPSLYGGGLFFDADHANTALRAWANWTPSLTERTTTSVALLRMPDRPDIPPPLRGRYAVHIRLAHIGDDADGEAVITPLRAIGKPLMDTVARMPFSAIGAIHADPTDPMPIWGTGNQLREFPEEAATALLAAAGPATEQPLLAVEIRQLGGAFARNPRPLDAVSGRDADFSMAIIGVPVPELFATAVPAAAGQVLAALSAWTLRGPLANFAPDANDVKALSSTWPAPTYYRLLQLKTRYDPDDVFQFGAFHSDGSERELG